MLLEDGSAAGRSRPSGQPSVAHLAHSGVKRIQPPVEPIAEQITHLGLAPRDATNHPTSFAGQRKMAGVRSIESSESQENYPARRPASVIPVQHGAAGQLGGDHSHGRKKLLAANQQQGSVGALMMHDGSMDAMLRAPFPGDARAMSSSADSLIFNRDLDGSSHRVVDPRQFNGAAGTRTEAGAEPVCGMRQMSPSFADVPHASFSAPGKRHGCPSSSAYSGAAGATTSQADAAYARDQMRSKVKLRAGASSAERLIFGSAEGGRTGSPGREDSYEPLLSGAAGTRSGAGPSHLIDPATRPTTKLTDQKIYGVGMVVTGTGSGASVAACDPRNFGGSAGTGTKTLNEKRASTFDITKLPGGGAGVELEYSGAGTRSQSTQPQGLRPVSAIQDFVTSSMGQSQRQLILMKPLRESRLGLDIDDPMPGVVIVRGVEPQSLAERCGLRRGDRLLAVAGRPVRNTDQAAELLGGAIGNISVTIGSTEGPNKSAEWAGSVSDHFACGQPGQRKLGPGADLVGVRPVSDISDMLFQSEEQYPSAGGW